METISPRLGFLRGVFLANHLASNDNLTRTTTRQNTYNENYNNIYTRGPNKQQHNKKHAKIWQTASPGLVALYNIRPGNGAGPFLQPRSPHGARHCEYLSDIRSWTRARRIVIVTTSLNSETRNWRG